MKRAWMLVFAFACSAAPPPPGNSVNASIVTRKTIAEGASLNPDDLKKQGEADPTAIAVVDGKVYAALANLADYAPAGPSFLGIYDAKTLAEEKRVALVKDDVQCRQAVALARTDDGLLVACSGKIAFPPDVTTDGALVDVSFAGEVRRIVTVGRSPGSVIRVGNDVWLGDGEGGGVSHVALDTFTVLAGSAGENMVPLCESSATKSGFVASLATADGRAFASCFNDDAVQEFDPKTGAKVGSPLATGSGPQHFARLGAPLWVLDDLGGTMTRIDLGSPATSARAVAYLGRDGTQGGNDPQGIDGDSEIAGVTNSAYGTFVVLTLEPSPKLVASVDLKPNPSAPTNYPGAVAWDGSAFVVAIPGLEFDTRNVPSELVRVEVQR